MAKCKEVSLGRRRQVYTESPVAPYFLCWAVRCDLSYRRRCSHTAFEAFIEYYTSPYFHLFCFVPPWKYPTVPTEFCQPNSRHSTEYLLDKEVKDNGESIKAKAFHS